MHTGIKTERCRGKIVCPGIETIRQDCLSADKDQYERCQVENLQSKDYLS